ncbi:MAG: HAD hydrolase family protein [Bacteroidetes bacterium]|nr:HAD hydrolase family protein [Bacteroidota bacterium]
MENKKIKFLALDVDGVLTDGGIYVTENGDLSKKFNVKDGVGIKDALKAGIIVGFISAASRSEKLTHARAQMLGVQYAYSGTEEKVLVLNKWLTKLKIKTSEVAFIGDDVNDLKIIAEVGFSACPSDAVNKIKKAVNVVLKKKGGDGCVREFIEKYLS